MKILKWLFTALAVLVLAVVIAIFAAAALVPDERSFVNEIDIDAPADKVWAVITDRPRYTEWQTQLDRVEIIDEKSWIEYPKSTPEPLKFCQVSDVRPASMEFEYTMGDSMHGRWRGEITPRPSGVKLKTTDSYHAQGRVTKILMRLFFDFDSFAKEWNGLLKRRVESISER